MTTNPREIIDDAGDYAIDRSSCDDDVDVGDGNDDGDIDIGSGDNDDDDEDIKK